MKTLDQNEDPHTERNGRAFNAHDHQIVSGVPLGDTGGAPKPAKDSTAVDLAAWGRGEKEYPFGEVVKAIDDHVLDQIYKIIDARFVSIKSRGDAMQFLIDEGLISSAEARADA